MSSQAVYQPEPAPAQACPGGPGTAVLSRADGILRDVSDMDDLRILLDSRHGVVFIDSNDEERLMGVVEGICLRSDKPQWIWSATQGLYRVGNPPQYNTLEADKALATVEELGGGVFVFLDAGSALANPVFVRRVKDFAQRESSEQTLLLVGNHLAVPSDLEGVVAKWHLKPPDRTELDTLVRKTIADLSSRGFKTSIDANDIEQMIDALAGVSTAEAERLLQQAALHDGLLAKDDVGYLRGAKAELLSEEGALELIESDQGTLADVGGMPNLKKWLDLRRMGLDPEGARFGLDPPRGVLLTGVPGAGKSLVAKTLAGTWQVPLVLLDPARLYGPFVGESEQRLSDSLETVEAMAPAVLWIDEIEKGFATGGEADGGVSRRLLGTFLRWMQDRPAGIFVVATCNQVATLPPEFLRRGRFDEVFFVDLPDAAARRSILELHLRKRKRDPAHFDLDALAARCDGFSGSEIESSIVAAMYAAFAAGRDITTEDLVAELGRCTPLSRSRAEEVAQMRRWGLEKATPA